MGRDERAIAAEISNQIVAMLQDLAGMPSVKSQAGASALLGSVRDDFGAWVARFVKGNANV